MIETRHLTKKFGSFTAVNDLTLSLRPGEIYGLLGPNGAGKTTTLLILLGIIAPTSGEVRLFGRRLDEEPFAVKRRIGVAAERLSFYDGMTAWEHLMFVAELYEASGGATRAAELLERLGLSEWRDARVGSFSTGMRRKLSLARALVHTPDALILDEPVANLDPYGIVQIRELLDAERARGCTILVSSHILSEVERTADRIGILVGGRLLVEDTMDNLRKTVGGRRHVRVVLVAPVNGLIVELQREPWVIDASESEGELNIYTLNDRDYRADLGRFLFHHQAMIQEMQSVEATLEETFLTLTESRVQTLLEQAGG